MTSDETGTTRTLARFASEATIDDVPPAAIDATKRVILDTLGCAVGGRDVESSRSVTRVKAAGGGVPESTVLVGAERLSCLGAAHVNAHYANALDAEETILHSGHLAASVVPPILAVAEREGSPGAEFVAAVAIGFDVAARIGISLKHIDLLDDGTVEIAPVSGLSWAAYGAAVGAGRLIGLDGAQMASAFGITAATTPLPIAGHWGRAAAPRPMTKYGMYGAIAEAGVYSALLAGEGFVGDDAILDGDRGFWRMMGSRRFEWDTVTDRLGERWLVEETSYKIYPACRFATPVLDLFYELKAESRLEADEIEHIEVLVPHAMLAKHMDDPTVVTVVDGQFSVPHVLALAACYGDPGPTWHTGDALSDSRLAEFAKRVTVGENVDAAPVLAKLIREQGYAEIIPTVMTVTGRGGSFTAKTDSASGDPWDVDRAVTDDDLRDKFRLFCAPHLATDKVEAAISLVRRLDDEPDLQALVSSLVA